MSRPLQSPVFTAAQAAFRVTLPILIGFGFCGFSYGLYMRTLGFEAYVPVLMALTIYAGSLEFILASMLVGTFAPLTAFIVSLVVNARHLFYGIAMLDRYRTMGWMRPFLIYALVDETFSILGTDRVPDGVERRWYYFFVSLFNESYWVLATAAGALLGRNLPFDTRGVEFVLPALFLSIFASDWQQEERHICSLGGLVVTFLCLMLFGPQYFLLVSMLTIVLLLLLFRDKLDPAKEFCHD